MIKQFLFLSAFVALFTACESTNKQGLTVVPYPNEVTVQTGTFSMKL